MKTTTKTAYSTTMTAATKEIRTMISIT